MEPIDRVALIVTPRRRFVEWVNGLPEAEPPLSIDDAKSLRAVFLTAVDDHEPDLQELIDAYWQDLFEDSLAGWTSDESLWPAHRTAHIFRDWFQVECVDQVTDADPDQPLTVSERVMTRCAACGAPLDEIVFVAFDEAGARRLTRGEAERYEEELERAVEGEESRPPMLVMRCCSDACASQTEAAYRDAVADRPDPG